MVGEITIVPIFHGFTIKVLQGYCDTSKRGSTSTERGSLFSSGNCATFLRLRTIGEIVDLEPPSDFTRS